MLGQTEAIRINCYVACIKSAVLVFLNLDSFSQIKYSGGSIHMVLHHIWDDVIRIHHARQ